MCDVQPGDNGQQVTYRCTAIPPTELTLEGNKTKLPRKIEGGGGEKRRKAKKNESKDRKISKTWQ